MDQLQRYHYELHLRLKLREDQGDAFQALFSRVMQKKYPGDFIATRPWGNVGDRKCDGYLASKRCLFACYAPQEATLTTTKSKLLDDFNGALPHQSQFWDGWCFVHNSFDGRLATDLVMTLAELRETHPHLNFKTWGPSEISTMVMALPAHEIASLLGPAPTLRDLAGLGLQDVADILRAVESGAPDTLDVSPTPPGKIEFNRLSQDISGLLKLGYSKSRLVGHYFNTHPDPERGDRIVAHFRNEYARMRHQGDESDLIFEQLSRLITGPVMPSPKILTSVYAVLAYLFEQCEIFERPLELPPAP